MLSQLGTGRTRVSAFAVPLLATALGRARQSHRRCPGAKGAGVFFGHAFGHDHQSSPEKDSRPPLNRSALPADLSRPTPTASGDRRSEGVALRSCSRGAGLIWGVLLCAVAAAAEPVAPAYTGRWTAEQAGQWFARQPWLVGCNFLPSTAVNDVAMWQRNSFDAETIDRELGWAQGLGFNSVRVFLNYVVWEDDAAGLKQRITQFLALADQHGISTMPILFDDCFQPEPRIGKQDEPEPGVHNSQWVQSPGARRRGDPAAWPKLEQYVKDLVGTFGHDQRIVVWDLYNEPSQSLPLVEATFRWAREVQPAQPLTTCIFGPAEMQQRILDLSDVISFHNYGGLAGLQGQVQQLRTCGRPLFCTEWMARGAGSRFGTHLPYFKEQRIGCWNWGLVAGRTQTYFPWGSPRGAPEPTLWHHDILRTDGAPYQPREIRTIRIITGAMTGAVTTPQVLVPTAQQQPITWRYSLEKPADNWFQPDFADAGWNAGAAPFGREEPPIDRHPNTVWTSADIWLRREFQMPPGQFEELALMVHHDEDSEIYLNGVLAAKLTGYNAAYEEYEISPAARAGLKSGKNHVAVHCRQTIGGQYFDLGVVGVAQP